VTGPPPPGRLLLTADPVGGVWTYAVALARGLGARGTEVLLATMGGPLHRDQRAEVARAPNVELAESRYRLEWMEDPWDDVARAGDWLLELERRHAPDLVHLNQLAFGGLPWRAPVLVVGHSCVLSWWQAVQATPVPPRWTEYRRRVGAGLRAADLVAAPTRAMLDAVEALYGPLARTAVIPNGRDPRVFRPGRKDELILAVGRLWDEAKNAGALARVASDLPWPIYFAGDPSGPDGRAPALGPVRALGRLGPAALARWFRRAAVYAHPARYEPFGLAVLEAGLSGCALVLGDIASLRELWQGAALFVHPDDTDRLRGLLRTLMLRQNLRAAFAERALARARSFTAARTLAAYRGAYARLARAGRRAPAGPGAPVPTGALAREAACGS